MAEAQSEDERKRQLQAEYEETRDEYQKGFLLLPNRSNFIECAIFSHWSHGTCRLLLKWDGTVFPTECITTHPKHTNTHVTPYRCSLPFHMPIYLDNKVSLITKPFYQSIDSCGWNADVRIGAKIGVVKQFVQVDFVSWLKFEYERLQMTCIWAGKCTADYIQWAVSTT